MVLIRVIFYKKKWIIALRNNEKTWKECFIWHFRQIKRQIMFSFSLTSLQWDSIKLILNQQYLFIIIKIKQIFWISVHVNWKIFLVDIFFICCRPLIFQTVNSARSKSLRFIYQRFTPSSCKAIRKLEFVAKNHFFSIP